jgi:hypothetical protein
MVRNNFVNIEIIECFMHQLLGGEVVKGVLWSVMNVIFGGWCKTWAQGIKLDFQKGNERFFIYIYLYLFIFYFFIKFMEEEKNKEEEIDFEINLKL